MQTDLINNLRKYIRRTLLENINMFEFDINNDMVDEERITNPDSKQYVANRENFIGSHIYGEDLGDLGLMYVAYSYGEQYPAFLWYKNKWYHNINDYINDDGSINEFTKQHMEYMRPNLDTIGLAGSQMKSMIAKFMRKHHIEKIDHTSVEPGEKN